MTDLDSAAVRAFVTAVDEGQFSSAAVMLGITQQAVSKRIAKLESDLDVRLFDRSRSGNTLTAAGLEMLPYARSMLAAADRTIAAARSELRPLRVAIVSERQATSQSVEYFLARNPESDIEIMISKAFTTSRDTLLSGRADVALARPHGGPRSLPAGISAVPAYVEPLCMLVNKNHPLAARKSVALAEIEPHPVWVPGASVSSEWADYFRELSEFSGIRVTTGWEPDLESVPGSNGDNGNSLPSLKTMLECIAVSDSLATFSGDGFLPPWNPHIRRLPITDPTPAYPYALLWKTSNVHPTLPHLIAHFRESYNRDTAADCWIPEVDRGTFLS
ncbi:LysR family transcriptional regulator [Nocardia sp. NEAU-G5]|uniref:LysR family transcriptional regulator n=1 Tax=Nocardia albiluteola TaxID=2842303 RepID=A0ABS6BFW9_9NOCA|nr:LysR family transcriptional regulator [Nocardia albiluteola]MBU3068099.1 LysR family transcriptional regulator [Nocardia albiluteola]